LVITVLFLYIVSNVLRSKSLGTQLNHECLLDVPTVDAYQKIAKIADHQASVQIVVGKSVAAEFIQEKPLFKV
jgi:hypothetical protein